MRDSNPRAFHSQYVFKTQSSSIRTRGLHYLLHIWRACLFPAECVTGIEPAPSVWKTDVLPLTPYTQLRGLFDKSPDGSEVPVFLASMDRHGVGPCSSALRADAFTGLAYDPQKNNRLLFLQTVDHHSSFLLVCYGLPPVCA